MAYLPSKPPTEHARPVPVWRVCWRLLMALLHLMRGLLTIAFLFPRLSQDQRALRVQVWSARLLACLGIRLVVQGESGASGPLLIVANHLSWLDITALHAARYCRFVSKADVARWPLIGKLASGVGTLFIERSQRRDALRVVRHMEQSLRAGEVLAVFPEGTTGDGTSLLPFHANLLQAAISADAPVQPVALQFIEQDSGQRSAAPLYTAQDTLLGSVWRTLRSSGIVVLIRFGQPQAAFGRERRAWAAELQSSVEQLLQARSLSTPEVR